MDCPEIKMKTEIISAANFALNYVQLHYFSSCKTLENFRTNLILNLIQEKELFKAPDIKVSIGIKNCKIITNTAREAQVKLSELSFNDTLYILIREGLVRCTFKDKKINIFDVELNRVKIWRCENDR